MDEREIEAAVRAEAERLGYRPGEFFDDHMAIARAVLGRVRDARGDDERSALNQTCCSGCTEPVRDEEPLRFRSGVLWHEACLAARSPQDEDPPYPIGHPDVNPTRRPSPQDEGHEVPCPRCDGKGREGGNTMPASRVCSLCHGTGKQVVRSPQDEGHEAGIEAARTAYRAAPTSWSWEQAFEAAVAAYLSRVSPSRVGSVAVEAHEAGVEAMAAEARDRGLLSRDDGEPSWIAALDRNDLRALAVAYLTRVSPSCVGSVGRCRMHQREDCDECFDWKARAKALVGSVAIEGVRAKLVSMIDRCPENPTRYGEGYLRALEDMGEVLAEFSRSSADRPEQPEPDVLGGQPPAEPETA